MTLGTPLTSGSGESIPIPFSPLRTSYLVPRTVFSSSHFRLHTSFAPRTIVSCRATGVASRLSFILHSSFFIFHSSFFILHSSFFILHSSLFFCTYNPINLSPYHLFQLCEACLFSDTSFYLQHPLSLFKLLYDHFFIW